MTTMKRRKNPNAVAMGKLGGRARARKLTREERRAIARKGGLARMRMPAKGGAL